MATAYFMELIIRMTDVQKDQDHLEMVIYNCPSIPDRTRYILTGEGVNPAEKMIEIGKKLDFEQVDCIAIPCITACFFHEQLTRGIKTPILHLIREITQYLKQHNYHSVGIMATDGTIQSRIFQQELEQNHIEAITPEEREQKMVMSLIYEDVKANRPARMEEFRTVETALRDQGAEVIILGCTELSVIKRDNQIGPGFLDAMEVLAMRSIQCCDHPLKEEYRDLITR